MAIKHNSVAVGTSPASLTGGVTDEDTRLGEGAVRSVLISNPTGGSSVFIGGSGVTTSAYGYELTAGAAVSLDLGAGDIPYGVVASGSVSVRVLHLGV